MTKSLEEGLEEVMGWMWSGDEGIEQSRSLHRQRAGPGGLSRGKASSCSQCSGSFSTFLDELKLF